MGQYQRHDFSLGWQPSADAFSAPKNSLLRADNLMLDELGVLALRQGSQKINAAALTHSYTSFDYTSAFETSYFTSVSGIAQFTSEADRPYLLPSMPGDGPANRNYEWEVDQGYQDTTAITSDTDVHSLFTATINGTRYRMSGAAAAVYANGTAVWNSLAGSNDIAFGAHMGHILFARSTDKYKYDGTRVRPWGIPAPAEAPVLTVLTTDSKVFASCASTESPVMTSNEGTQAFAADRAGTANAAVEIQPDSTTGRGTSTKTFALATDFTVYDGGQTGSDEDLIDFYAYVTEPQYIDSLTLMIDVNDGTFQEDWYQYTFRIGDATGIVPGTEESLESIYTVEGEDRDYVISRMEPRESAVTTFRQDEPVSNTGWNHFNVPRGAMERHGLTAGKNWSTVLAVRIIVNAIAGGTGAAVRWDAIQIIGGAARPLTGTYKAALIAVRNDGVYQALSAPSAFSSEIEVKAQGIRATLSAAAVQQLDAQVNELWLFLMGGRLDAFYRFTVLTGGPFGGAQTIDATTSEVTALIANIRMETDNTTPPDTMIGIEGPHFDRTLCLTATHIYPSRQLNPDSFATGEAVRVGDAAETALWIKKLGESGLYVGTTRDIYRFDGDWTILPDGSINVFKRPMHIAEPPISAAIEVGTINGVETLIYLSGDGWKVLGSGSLVNNAVDLLWRGFTRHGVSPVNITGSTARFRAAVAKNILFALTPEGSSTTSSSVIHAYHFTKQRWYRFTYPQAFRSLYAEQDGTLIAGDSSGFVRTLDLATKQDDGVNIPVVLWTPHDDNGEPWTYKQAENMWMRLDTAAASATIGFHLNGNNSESTSTATQQQQTDTANLNVSTVAEFSQMQLRLTGSFSTFVMRGWGLRYLDVPVPQVIHDTGFVDLSSDVIKWVDRLRIKAKSSVNLTVTPYWDGTAGTARTITVGTYSGRVTEFVVPLGREDKGKIGRVVITSSSPSHVYYVKFQLRGSGQRDNDKMVPLVPEVA